MDAFHFHSQCGHCLTRHKIPWFHEKAGEKSKTICPNCKLYMIVNFPLTKPMETVVIDNSRGGYAGAVLELIKNDYGDGGTYPIQKPVSQVGRVSQVKKVDIPFVTTDMRMSRLHFTIRKEDKGDGIMRFTISGREGNNGTIHNGIELQNGMEVYLKDGDIIEAGSSKIIFKAVKA